MQRTQIFTICIVYLPPLRIWQKLSKHETRKVVASATLRSTLLYLLFSANCNRHAVFAVFPRPRPGSRGKRRLLVLHCSASSP